MKPETLLHLYPRPWRERYGDEFLALLEKEGTGPRVVMSVMAGAFDAWMSPKTPSEMALDGPFGPGVLRERVDTKEDLWSKSHWRYLLAAIGAGLLTQLMGVRIHEDAATTSFTAGFLSAIQLWNFRFFSVRTRLAAAFWTFVIMAGGWLLIHSVMKILIKLSGYEA